MISILLLSINRYEELTKTLERNLACIGVKDYELLVCDNGSTDKRVIDFIKFKNPVYFRQNSKNEGVGKSFNQLYLRSKGDVIALMSNDIFWPKDWGLEMTKYLNAVPNSGLCGINWGHSGTPPITKKFGLNLHWLTPKLNRVFGPTAFRREVVNQVGLFSEDFDVYALEDSDFNERVNRAGFNSFYLTKLKADHIGHDVGEKTDYRKMKDESMERNLTIFNKKISKYEAHESIKEPLPPLRESL